MISCSYDYVKTTRLVKAIGHLVLKAARADDYIGNPMQHAQAVPVGDATSIDDAVPSSEPRLIDYAEAKIFTKRKFELLRISKQVLPLTSAVRCVVCECFRNPTDSPFWSRQDFPLFKITPMLASNAKRPDGRPVRAFLYSLGAAQFSGNCLYLPATVTTTTYRFSIAFASRGVSPMNN